MDEYVREVARRLRLPRAMKRRIIADLRETFASAAENGETESQVIARLGSPDEFAREVLSSSDVPPRPVRRFFLLPLGLAALCAAGALLSWLSRPQLPEGVIGGADEPTHILVTGPWSTAGLLGTAAAALLVLAAVMYALYRRRRAG